MSALWVALFLFASTASAACQVACAIPAELDAIAHALPAEVAAPHRAACHRGEGVDPQPLSERSGKSCREGCCTVLALAAATPLSSPDSTTPPAPPLPAGFVLDDLRGRSALLGASPLPARLVSPFQFQNPPLLI